MKYYHYNITGVRLYFKLFILAPWKFGFFAFVVLLVFLFNSLAFHLHTQVVGVFQSVLLLQGRKETSLTSSGFTAGSSFTHLRSFLPCQHFFLVLSGIMIALSAFYFLCLLIMFVCLENRPVQLSLTSVSAKVT